MSVDKAACGTPLAIGLRVLTNNWRWGTIVGEPSEWNPGWWKVLEDGKERPDIFDEGRMTTKPPAGAPERPEITPGGAL